MHLHTHIHKPLTNPSLFFPGTHTHTHTHRRQGLCVWLVRNEEIKLSIVLPISAAVTMRCLRLTRSPDGTRETERADVRGGRERAIVEEKRVVGERKRERERDENGLSIHSE